MANKHIFGSKPISKAPIATAVNNAGGRAYQSSDKHALARFAVTGCFTDTFYTSAKDQLAEVKKMILGVKHSPHFIAKLAIYSRKAGFMKDMPAYLVAVLATLDNKLFHKVFDEVIDNGKMLRNFCQIARSGEAGKVLNLSAGACRSAIRRWFNNRSCEYIFRASVGNNPSLADVIKLARPNVTGDEKRALLGYILGRTETRGRNLPQIVLDFEAFKKNQNLKVPNVDFQQLTALPLQDKHWKEIASNAKWQMLRMNLNTFARHNVFNDTDLLDKLAKKLSNKEEVAHSGCFPYQLFTAYQATEGNDIPFKMKNALQDAMEAALENVPAIKGKVYVAVDVSGSMRDPVTGKREDGTPSKTRCVDVAALFGASILRKNKDAEVIPFETTVMTKVSLNPRDTVLTNADKLAKVGGGGTNCSCVLQKLNNENAKGDVVVYVSDNESWVDSAGSSHYYGQKATATMTEWEKFKKRNPKAKMICIDITPSRTAQTVPSKDILQVSGFSDSVFTVIDAFLESNGSSDHWVELIESIQLN